MQNLYFYRNKSFITLLILVVLSVSMMFLDKTIKSFRFGQIFFFIVNPISNGVRAVGEFFGNAFTGIARIRQLEQELAISKERLVKYQEKLLLYSQIVKENERLKSTLNVKEKLEHDAVYARVVFRDPTLMGDYFVIDKGRLDQIKENMAVVTFDTNGNLFLVGKTSEVNLSAAKVKLLTAKNFYVGVALKDTGYIGILTGMGSWNQNCVIDYVPIEANAYIGEAVVTSGESDIFPYGINVGTIVGIGKSVMEEFFQKIYLKPDYDYTRLKDVFIINWQPNTEAKPLIEDSYEKKSD